MAGEFFVLAQLCLRGFTPALTFGNAKKVDILVKARALPLASNHPDAGVVVPPTEGDDVKVT
jgi:hypothetical protein